MGPVLLSACLGLQAPPPAPAQATPATVQGSVAPSSAQPLSFFSEAFPFRWDVVIPLKVELDGLKVSQIFFNKRVPKPGFLGLFKGTEFGTRAQVEVTNTSKTSKVPGFAVAVLDKDGRLLGAASGGTKLGTIKPGETETFDLNFTQVKERLSKGDRFLLSIELRD
jgi:hypothetical protein